MTDDMMNLRSLVEKSADADLLREMIGFAAEKLMALEVGTKTGAGYGEKNSFRLAQRNGYRDRDWETRAGTVELRIVGLFPDLAIVQVVLAPLGKATELSRQYRHDWLIRAKAEKAAVAHNHFLAPGFHCLLAHLFGGLADPALQPGIERGQFGRAELVQAGGAELFRTHLLLQVSRVAALCQRMAGVQRQREQ